MPVVGLGKQFSFYLAVIILALCWVPASQAASPADNQPNSAGWLQSHLLNNPAKLPFSFAYGLKSSASLMPGWQKRADTQKLDEARIQHNVSWTDPATGLTVRIAAVEFANSPVVEWTMYFRNGGKADTPILEDVQPLDLSLPVAGSRVPTVIYSRGAGGMDTYALRKQPLDQLQDFTLANDTGGKPLNSIPFFDIQMEGRGLIGALGWLGQWAISFSRSTEGTIDVRAGMQTTHLSLHPGEEIRTPLVLLLPWQGDDIEAHNILRRHVLQYHTPHYDGKPVVLPVSHLGWGGMKTSTSLLLIDQVSKEKLGFENFWMDAGWYGTDRPVDEFQVFGHEDWFLHAGNWRVNRVPHPNGLKPISDAARANGMKFLLWFEPERAVVGTPWTLEHPDWYVGEDSTYFAGDVNASLREISPVQFRRPGRARRP